MKRFRPICGFVFLIFLSSSPAQNTSQMRPVVLGTGSSSLVNKLDPVALLKHGQGDTMVNFITVVSELGDTRAYYTRIYGGMPESKFLTEELIGKIDRAIFHPALYRGTPQATVVFGTVVFFVRDGKPHLRIFLNQEMDELKRGSDFISPQLVLLPGTKFKGIDYPLKGGGASGNVAVRMDIDATGRITGKKLLHESPAGRGFGAQVMSQIGDATFLPAYRNGKPVSCSFTMPMIFKGVGGRQWKANLKGVESSALSRAPGAYRALVDSPGYSSKFLIQ